jgi:hypothetical protein
MFILLNFLSGFDRLLITNIPFLVIILIINYIITIFCLKISGLVEKAEKELKEIEYNKKDYED